MAIPPTVDLSKRQAGTGATGGTQKVQLGTVEQRLLLMMWGVIAVLGVIFTVIALPQVIQLREQVAQAEMLSVRGLTPRTYAILQTIPDLLLIAVFGGMSIFLLWHRRSERSAMYLSLALLAYGGASNAMARQVFPQMESGWRSAQIVMDIVGVTLCMSTAFYFPDGRFVPRWTRFIPGILVLWLLIWNLFPAFWEMMGYTKVLRALTFNIVVLIVGISVGIYRYRYVSTPVQRQQTKWIIYGFVIAMIGFILFSSLPNLIFPALGLPEDVKLILTLIFSFLSTISSLATVGSVLFSLLRYRLWDIDFVINRGLVYGSVTLVLGLLFAGTLFIAQQVLRLVMGADQPLTVPLVVAALVIGAVFRPAQAWLRSFVDRRLFNIEVDYKEAGRQEKRVARVASTDLADDSLGAYRDLAFIGRGGMADVYRAVQRETGRTVAIKVLLPGLAADQDFRRRFEREASVIRRLKHPNIVELIDSGKVDDLYYIAMEYINGDDLAALIRAQGALPIERASQILTSVAAALDYAHAQGVIHRDIKPSNILIDVDQRVVLSDFGIARMTAGETRLTTTGMVGTVDYMAPEQIQGAAEVDARADVYSLGVMTYEMLTGKRPFAAANPAAVLLAHLNQPAPDPRERIPAIPREAAYAIQRAMSKRPADRFATAGAFAAEIMESVEDTATLELIP